MMTPLHLGCVCVSPSTGDVPTCAGYTCCAWTQHSSKLRYSYCLKREEFLRGIGLKLLLINILEILTIK